MKPPPEETLLRLIRGKGSRAAADSSAPAAATGTAVAVAAVGLGGRARSMPWPRVAIGCLGVALLIEVVGLLVEVMRPLPTVHAPVATPSVSSEPAHAAAPAPEIPSLEASLSHPIFTASAAGPTAQPAARTGPSGSAKELASRLTLMGIVSGNPGEAVIEDAQTKKTYFVTTGQAVADGAILERILDNRVILDLNGEKIDLTL